jgi:hypothetical protein
MPRIRPAMTHASSGGAVTDPLGRTVVLSAERWVHITTRHPELRPHRADVLEAVQARPAGFQGGGRTRSGATVVGGS